ncbi:hypothetical protein C8T65DRAFT_639534 [Cerioporus squamosus]|nr:hypothetical protein C8T65DRAFT_639534 [Cerioporus squamosus]
MLWCVWGSEKVINCRRGKAQPSRSGTVPGREPRERKRRDWTRGQRERQGEIWDGR